MEVSREFMNYCSLVRAANQITDNHPELPAPTTVPSICRSLDKAWRKLTDEEKEQSPPIHFRT